MLNIALPHIAVQKVENGYVIQWQQRNPDRGSARRTISRTAVAMDDAALLEVILRAARDIDAVEEG